MIRLSAPAKINLFLEITGKRPDGYHTLETIFQTISLADRLTFSPEATLVMTCSDRTLPVNDTNLVMRAARALQIHLQEKRGARIHLEKIVPTGAGLGGGSSDAAATLRGLLKLWKRNVPAAALARLAVKLGADVPFFLKGGLCAATGIGEKLKSLPSLPKTWLVLVYPDFGVSTKEAYARVKLPFQDSRHMQIERPSDNLFNRFEDLVFPEFPRLTKIKRDLLNAGAFISLMSGSGSSIFGLVANQAEGQKTLEKIKRHYPQSWLVHTL